MLDIQQIVDSESPFRGSSHYAPQHVLDMIEADKNDPRKKERKPPSEEVEFALEQKELSDESVEGYKFEGQDILLDEKSRLINWMSVKDFMIKLLSSGIPFFLTDSNFPGLLGLWAGFPQNTEEHKTYICSIQYPMAPEWSVIRLDDHGLPQNFRYKGWRTSLAQIIRLHILTEEQVHKIFGSPVMCSQSTLYKQQLYQIRNN